MPSHLFDMLIIIIIIMQNETLTYLVSISRRLSNQTLALLCAGDRRRELHEMEINVTRLHVKTTISSKNYEIMYARVLTTISQLYSM